MAGVGKVIDVHVHLSESPRDFLIKYAKMNGFNYTLDEYVSIMKRYGIFRGLLLSPPLLDGKPLPNQGVISLCKQSGSKLLPILTVEPAAAEVEAALRLAKLHRSEIKGFKIRLGYHSASPVDKVFDPVYDYAESRSFPVLFHTGDTANTEGILRLSHPLGLDDLSNARPDLKIVACHFGNPWIDDVAELIYKHENFFADISGLFAGGGDYARQHLTAVSRRLSEAIYYVGNARKILFGSDYPVSDPGEVLKLVESIKVSDSDKEKILYRNAAELFHI